MFAKDIINKNEWSLHGVSWWVKKDNPDFDVTMGSYDGAEICELEGLYILDILTKESGHDKIGLYRDEGFGCF